MKAGPAIEVISAPGLAGPTPESDAKSAPAVVVAPARGTDGTVSVRTRAVVAASAEPPERSDDENHADDGALAHGRRSVQYFPDIWERTK
jgi:hypothetical protein